MPIAKLNDTVVAESENYAFVEGNVYFPITSVAAGILKKSREQSPTYCHWKGTAEYFDVVFEDWALIGACWTYPAPYEEASVIADHVAFWRGVDITGAPEGKGLVGSADTPLGNRKGWEALAWLICYSKHDLLSADDIKRETGIEGNEFLGLWHHEFVQFYANRRK
ncbi:MAG: DUF427 domain-containing protein [Methyloligellaceae bacterium]